jgi:hypothetical protein
MSIFIKIPDSASKLLPWEYPEMWHGAIKQTFLALHDAALTERMEIAPVDFAIEPIDDLEVGAWAARTNGILTLAKQSLHFELPSHGLMSSARQRNFYTPILAELVVKMIPHLRVGR